MFIYRLSIFISAILLFQVQLLIARYILPWFGGSAAVWMASMLFFQLLLVAGYGYSHWLVSHIRSTRKQAAIHIGVLLLSCVVLLWQKLFWGYPLLPDAGLRPDGGGFAVLKILQILTISVGLPFFALSATSSLLQSWFSSVWNERSPYSLYALSNAGSILGLLSYPLLLTPFIGLRVQSMLWASGFFVFAIACMGAAVAFLKKGTLDVGERCLDSKQLEKPSWARRLLWIMLPAVGTVLMMATTNVLTQDIAVMPMLWVLPLALYLLSYVVAFSGRLFGRGNFYWLIAAIVGLYGLLYVALLPVSYLPTAKIAAPYLLAMFVACVYCHGMLASLKPAVQHLTGFYFSLSIGGALGGVFVAVLSPVLFTSVAEFPIGYLLCAILIFISMQLDRGSVFHGTKRWAWRCVVGFFILALGIGLNFNRFSDDRNVRFRQRNFFGVLRVWRSELTNKKTGQTVPVQFLSHGNTTHGLQVLDSPAERIPTSYYGRLSGLGVLMECSRKEGMNVGGVGLGVGTLAAYGRTGDHYRLYEIDRDIIALASDPARGFTYLSGCSASMELILGDARLSLENELGLGGNDFDVLVLDAFTGDAVPEHLLTKEAFEIYKRHLAPGGAIAVHISSRHFNLAPLVFRLAESSGFSSACYDFKNDNHATEFSSTWVIVSSNQRLLNKMAAIRKPSPPPQNWRDIPLWTDDFSNLLQLLQIDGECPFL